MLDCGKITIGNHVFLAPHVQLYTVNHPIHLEQRDADYEYTKPITIKDHVWIGGNSTVLPGVTIGENSIIGAGSVVTKDIPANVIAVGNPRYAVVPFEENHLLLQLPKDIVFRLW